MKKFALALLLGLVAGVTQADLMLYWTVDKSGKYAIPGEAKYATLYGSETGAVDGMQALDTIIIGSRVDTNITDYQSESARYMIRLFNESGDEIVETTSYSYNQILVAGSQWHTDTMGMKADTVAVLNSKMQFAPEPTSGLLMLLGLAGLALKRKRV